MRKSMIDSRNGRTPPVLKDIHDKRSSRDTVSQGLFVEGLLAEFESEMNERYGRIIAENDLWDFALDLAFHDDPRVAFRSSWALEWAYFNDRESFRPHTAHFFDNFLKAANPSAHRHYSKMLYDMMRRGAVTLDHGQACATAEKCFELLIDPSTRVAVKVWCMEILFDLRPRLDWLEENLRDAVQILLDTNPSAGLANRGFKLLKRLDKLRGKTAVCDPTSAENF